MSLTINKIIYDIKAISLYTIMDNIKAKCICGSSKKYKNCCKNKKQNNKKTIMDIKPTINNNQHTIEIDNDMEDTSNPIMLKINELLNNKNKMRKIINTNNVINPMPLDILTQIDKSLKNQNDLNTILNSDLTLNNTILDLLEKIKDYLNNTKYNIHQNIFTGNIEVCFPDKNAILTILKDSTWTEIKRHIDFKLSPNPPKECLICLNKIIQNVSCTKCSCYTCIDCYINNFKTNKGLIICPFCRFTFGHKCSDSQIEMGIKIIKNSQS